MNTTSHSAHAACIECGSKTVDATIDETAKFRYDGKLYDVHVPQLTVNQCTNCSAIFYDNRADKQISCALRDQLKLLQPEQIQANRLQLGLKQVQLADSIGVAAESLSRWENGHVIQSRSHDLLLRTYFTMPEFRERVTKARLPATFMTTWTGATRESKITFLQSNNIQVTEISAADTQVALAA